MSHSETMKQITSYQPHLSNADYIMDAIAEELSMRDYNECLNDIKINDLSMYMASGYGTWKVGLTITIDGSESTHYLTHHNEDWFRSQKMVYDLSIANSEEEQQEAIDAFQAAYEAVIDANIDSIVNTCIASFEEEVEAE